MLTQALPSSVPAPADLLDYRTPRGFRLAAANRFRWAKEALVGARNWSRVLNPERRSGYVQTAREFHRMARRYMNCAALLEQND